MGKKSLLHDHGQGVGPQLPSNPSHLCSAQRFGVMAPWVRTVLLRFLHPLVSDWVEPMKPPPETGWGEKLGVFSRSPFHFRGPGNSRAPCDELPPNASPPLGSGNAIPVLASQTPQVAMVSHRCWSPGVPTTIAGLPSSAHTSAGTSFSAVFPLKRPR